MNQTDIQDVRRALLQKEVDRIGLAAVAKKADKPVRQINDMLHHRKTFGDKVARAIGPKVRPDLRTDWLVTPTEYEPAPPLKAESPSAKRYDLFSPAIVEVIQIMETLNAIQQREIVGAVKMLSGNMQNISPHGQIGLGQ